MENQFCTNCGAKMPEEGNFCTACGAPKEETRPQQDTAAGPSYYTQPSQPVSYQNTPPAADSQNSVVSVGSYIGMALLFALPGVGLIVCIVFACGGTTNLNKRNYARAVLILSLIAFTLAILVGIVIGLIGASFFREYYREMHPLLQNIKFS